MSDHTPGPWEMCGNQLVMGNGGNGPCVAAVKDDNPDLEANARLIKASPLLFDACENAPLPESLDYTNPEKFMRLYLAWYRSRTSAVAKARGQNN